MKARTSLLMSEKLMSDLVMSSLESLLRRGGNLTQAEERHLGMVPHGITMSSFVGGKTSGRKDVAYVGFERWSW